MGRDDLDTRFVPIPHDFLRDVLRATRELAELKSIFYVAYLASSSGRRTVDRDELMAPDALHAIAGEDSPEPAETRVRRALDRAVVNGALLQLIVLRGGQRKTLYLTATAESRDAVERFKSNDSAASTSLGIEVDDEVEVYRPNIFGLYERVMGPLTPLIAEQLRDAERSYPREWIEQAMYEAAEREHRSWRYVEAILTRWEAGGAPRRLRTPQ
jgi:DnaD/phage-associated family protein